MLKPALLALAGLAALTSTAAADAIVPLLPRPDLSAVPAPAVDLCDRYGVACSVPGVRNPEWNWAPFPFANIPRFTVPQITIPRAPQIPHGLGRNHGQMAEIMALLEGLQHRLNHRSAPLPHRQPSFTLQHPFFDGSLPFVLDSRPYTGGPVRPFGGPYPIPGNSFIILR